MSEQGRVTHGETLRREGRERAMVSTALVATGVVQLLLAWAASRRRGGPGRWIAVLGVALAYDSLVVATGAAVGEGAVLEALNTGRFLVHAVLTPLAVVCGALLL